MTEYIYLASDKPLALGDYGDSGIHIGKLDFYFTSANFASFYFKEASFSSNLKLNSKDIYSVSSAGYELPEKGTKKIKRSEKKALSILFKYISSHFIKENAEFLNILFILNGYDVDSTLQRKKLRINELTLEDLYYSEQLLLEIVR